MNFAIFKVKKVRKKSASHLTDPEAEVPCTDGVLDLSYSWLNPYVPSFIFYYKHKPKPNRSLCSYQFPSRALQLCQLSELSKFLSLLLMP